MEDKEIKILVDVDECDEITRKLWVIIKELSGGSVYLDTWKRTDPIREKIIKIFKRSGWVRVADGRGGFEVSERQLEEIEEYVKKFSPDSTIYEIKRQEIRKVLWDDFTREFSLRKLLEQNN